MHPVLFHFGGFVIRSEGALYIVAAFVTGLCAYRAARRSGADTRLVVPGLAVVVAAAYLGARFHGSLNHWMAASLPADSLTGVEGAADLSFFGGLVLGMLALVAFLKWNGLPIAAALDELAPIGPVVYAIFRLGCLLNGDDYGVPTGLPWGMAFPEGVPPTVERVHPVQLYEIALMAPIALWARWKATASRPPGALAFEVFVLMGVERLVVDFYRPAFGASAGLSGSQWLALGLASIGAVGRIVVARRSISPPPVPS